MIEIEKPQIECIETPGDDSYGKKIAERYVYKDVVVFSARSDEADYTAKNITFSRPPLNPRKAASTPTRSSPAHAFPTLRPGVLPR